MGERRWLISSTIGVKIAVDYGKVPAPLALCQNGLITINCKDNETKKWGGKFHTF